jgi:hypothetical protein
MPNSPSGIDVNFDFTSDTPGFWDGLDAKSPMARRYHQLLWSGNYKGS